jgi:abhydrolase domain-containing protein 6
LESAAFHDVKASGLRLRVTERGEGPTLLLLHTALLDRTSWGALIDDLANDFRVVAPDLPGFGESVKPNETRFAYTVDAFAEVIADLFAGLALGQACVVGHGLGAAIAIRLANRFPELVSRLVLVDALCYQPKRDPVRRLALVPVVGAFVLKQLWGRRLFGSYFRSRLTGPHAPLPPPRVQHYYEAFRAPNARSSALATLRATNDTRSTRAALTRISVPSLVVWGRHDALCSASFGLLMAKQIRNAGFELLDTGHCPQEETPARLTEVVRQFARAQRAQGGTL